MTRVRTYVWATCAVALLLASSVYVVAPEAQPDLVMAVFWLSAISLAAHLLVYQLPSGALGSIGFIPFMATALLSPNWVAVLSIASASAIAQMLTQKELIKRVFNTAQLGLAASLAILAYRALGGASLLSYPQYEITDAIRVVAVPLIAMTVLFVAANTLVVSGIIATAEGKSVVQVWRQNHLGGLVYDFFSTPAVFVLAWFYVRFGPVGAVGLVVPLFGVRQLYKTNRQLESINQELLELMVKAIEARDPYTSGHSRRVAHYSRVIARAIGLSSREVERIGIAALLHDVGKIHEIYAPILRKPDKLTPDEWSTMQTHPIKSAELVGTVSQLKDVVPAVRHHHENWDGTGYPDGLAEEGIPLGSRIVLIADTIDAMTTDRPYRKALGELQVRAELAKNRGRQFDPQLCDKLLESPMFGLLFSSSQALTTPAENTSPSAPRVSRVVARA